MADPLSVTASAIALGTLITGTIKAIEKVRQLPQAIQDLLEEVTELDLVLHHVESLIRSTSSQSRSPLVPELDLSEFSKLVGRIQTTLSEVRELLSQHVARSPVCDQDHNSKAAGTLPLRDIAAEAEKIPVNINWVSGKRTLLRLSNLKKKLESASRSLVLALSAISGARSTHLEYAIYDLMHAAHTSRIEYINHFQHLRESIGALSHNLMARPQTLQLSDVRAIDIQKLCVNAGDMLVMASGKSDLSLPDLEKQVTKSNDLGLKRVRRQGYGQHPSRRRPTSCSPTCVCTCHKRRSISSDPRLNLIFGTFNVDMIASRAIGGRCSERSCRIRGPTTLNIEYIFPFWFLMMLISVTIQVPKLSNLILNIKSARIRPDSSLLFRFAMEGNADGIRDLFDRGLASPFDVDASTQTSALVYATGWHHPKVWRLLLEAGADPYAESTTRHSPMVNVWRSLLEAGFVQKALGQLSEKTRKEDNSDIPEDILIALKGDFDLEEYMERRRFPVLHQIVMGLVDIDLEAQLMASTATIDSGDQQGLTALSWAATTGDVDSVETLLRFGANPNLVAFNGDTALHYAVRTLNPGCIEPLIRYAADVNAQNAWAVTPLHYATMNRDDLQHVIPLVKANANVDLVDQHGRTPLFRAVKYNRPKIVQYLLEHNAQLLVDSWGQHPLSLALDSGFHEVLDTMLAQRGHMFTTDQMSVSLSRAEELEDHYAIGLFKEKLSEISRQSFTDDESFVSSIETVVEESFGCRKDDGVDSGTLS